MNEPWHRPGRDRQGGNYRGAGYGGDGGGDSSVKTIRILSWNVNGIRAAAAKGLGDWIEDEGADIVCLQETKAQAEQIPDDLAGDQYHRYVSSASRRGYSGVVTYSRLKPIAARSGFGVERFDTEGRTVITEYDDFTLFNVYFPNGGASAERLKFKLEFYDTFLKHLSKVKKRQRRIIVCGDFNTAHKEIDLARPKENETVSGFLPEERARIDELVSAGFVDSYRVFDDSPGKYTWWDYKTGARARNVGWRIDYFFVSEPLKKGIRSAFIMADVMGSDHCPIGLELRIK